MSVAVLLVTHEKIGSDMIAAAESIIGEPAANVGCIEVPLDSPVPLVTVEAQQVLNSLNTSEGTLVLTDSFGSTPSNIASTLLVSGARLISGLNLPMLLRILNYRELPLDELCDKAVSGAQASIAVHD